MSFTDGFLPKRHWTPVPWRALAALSAVLLLSRSTRWAAPLVLAVGGVMEARNGAHLRTAEQRRRVRIPPLPAPPGLDVPGFECVSGYVQVPRGLKIAYRTLIPPNPRALVVLVHGFGDSMHWMQTWTAAKLYHSGFATLQMDLEGHGLSDGIAMLVPDFAHMTDDVMHVFDDVLSNQKPELAPLKRFFLGESMGGAVVLKLALAVGDAMDGAILVAPMAKIEDSMKPPAAVISLSVALANVFPSAPIAPVPDVINEAFRRPDRRLLAYASPFHYPGKPRLRTAVEMLHSSLDLERRLDDVATPFLIMHGGSDRVTSRAVSEELHRRARSTDKTIRIYDGFWHAVTGESDDDMLRALQDIADWVGERC